MAGESQSSTSSELRACGFELSVRGSWIDHAALGTNGDPGGVSMGKSAQGRTRPRGNALGQSQVRQRTNIGPPLPTCSGSADAMVSVPATPDYRSWRVV